MTQPKEIFVKTDLCLGCKSCEIACAVAHSKSKSLFGAISEFPAPKARVYVEWKSPDYKIPLVCRHCEEAPCMHACISGAIRREKDNTVVTDEDRCIGCWTCVMVCPYGMIGRHLETKKAYRCDRCPDLETPACVSACPTEALIYDTADSFSKQMRKQAAAEILQSDRG